MSGCCWITRRAVSAAVLAAAVSVAGCVQAEAPQLGATEAFVRAELMRVDVVRPETAPAAAPAPVSPAAQ